jgi:hypothetical protein
MAAPGDRWLADETYVKVAGQWAYLYRAVGQRVQVTGVLLSARRDLAAAYRCRHGHTTATRPDPARPGNAYIREDQILPRLPALASFSAPRPAVARSMAQRTPRSGPGRQR